MSTQYKSCYRFITDPGHGWLEVPRSEVVASGANISPCSYYDPKTRMVYLEEDADAPAFLKATGRKWSSLTVSEVDISENDSSTPRCLPAYETESFMERRLFLVRADRTRRVH